MNDFKSHVINTWPNIIKLLNIPSLMKDSNRTQPGGQAVGRLLGGQAAGRANERDGQAGGGQACRAWMTRSELFRLKVQDGASALSTEVEE